MPRMRFQASCTLVFRVAFLWIGLSAFPSAPEAAPQSCRDTTVVLSDTNLSDLSEFWFGNPNYRFAIMLATNARSADPQFAFISDPNQLLPGTAANPARVCIPELPEAERLRNRYDLYLEAVHDMALAEPSEIVDSLDPVPTAGPARVVSWVRADQLAGFPTTPGESRVATGAIWITLAPNLQTFCREFVSQHNAHPDAVTLRIEQRLGLPPASSKTHFIELEIDEAAGGASLFRPCGDPAVTTTSCSLGGPAKCATGDNRCNERREFFFEQYYSAYGTERPVEYPWTSLGYTFDWAPGDVGAGGRIGFVEVGESEYVVPPGTEVSFVGATSTLEYCTPPG
jgi:hypothetical protein